MARCEEGYRLIDDDEMILDVERSRGLATRSRFPDCGS